MTAAAPVPEAVLLSEYWGEVLCFAQLCTLTPEAGGRLAADAFDRGLAAAKDPYPSGSGGAGLPCLPFLLTAVRDSTAHWAAAGDGDSLQPELRIWLNAERAARRARTGARRPEPLALRGLRAMPERAAEALWYAEVECRPAADPDGIHHVREVFREHCLRAHVAEPPTPECAGYAVLLDAATRTGQEPVPVELRRHLDRCPECAKAVVCLSPHGDGLAQALAEGVLGWAGPSYLEARRQAVGTGGARPPFPYAGPTPPRRLRRPAGRGRGPLHRGLRGRVPGGRVAVVAAAGLLAAVVGLTVLVTADDSAPRAASAAPTVQGGTDPDLSPLPGPAAPDDPSPTASQDPADDGSFPGDTEPSAAEHTIPAAPDRTPERSAPPARSPHASASARPATCSVSYTLVDRWSSGFQAAVTVTTRVPVSDWRLEWTFPDGERVTQMWDADFTQYGTSVAVRGKGYNDSLATGGSATFGFIGARDRGDGVPASFSLGGSPCTA
ncbi:cellulose binding domain-containing protein [Streptomyces sp. NPDC046977]|uniref:cellulose binding domain-containing protein n=1 Tax=Streptomyces sp. NPDC046977 TaxID=3154703 RepID=UPI0033F2BEAC